MFGLGFQSNTPFAVTHVHLFGFIGATLAGSIFEMY